MLKLFWSTARPAVNCWESMPTRRPSRPPVNGLKPFDKSVLLVNDNFVNLRDICVKYDFFPVHGILFDLGLSSPQLDEEGRGFSFQYDAPLDMRFSPTQRTTAADIVNTYSEMELARILKTYGEEINSRQIARRIVQKRPIRTTTGTGRYRGRGGRRQTW